MIPNINLTHLKYFHDTVLLKSVSAAARENFVSQSAISQGITKLEQALQVKITTHQRQAFNLTEEGEIVFRKAKIIFGNIENLKNLLSELKSEISGNVHFACTNTIAQYFLVSKYLKIKEIYPLIKLIFERGSLNYIHEALRLERVPFAIVIDAPEFDGYEKIILSKGKFHLYKLKDICPTTQGIFVDHPDTFEVAALRKSYFEAHNKTLIIQEALTGWGMVASFILNGCGVGFLPEFVFLGNESVSIVDFDIPPIEYSICAIKLKSTILSTATLSVLKALKDHPGNCMNK
jgi:DNA-binding transcriptional LysR family regulator